MDEITTPEKIPKNTEKIPKKTEEKKINKKALSWTPERKQAQSLKMAMLNGAGKGHNHNKAADSEIQLTKQQQPAGLGSSIFMSFVFMMAIASIIIFYLKKQQPEA